MFPQSVKEGFLKEREQALLDADKATSEKRFAWGAEEVWQMAQEGRGWKLLVESGYSYPAKISDDKLSIVPAIPEDDGSEEDAVDLIIDTVIAKGGEVIFFDDGMLESYNHIALIMRY